LVAENNTIITFALKSYESNNDVIASNLNQIGTNVNIIENIKIIKPKINA
jgi:hypothetical protein